MSEFNVRSPKKAKLGNVSYDITQGGAKINYGGTDKEALMFGDNVYWSEKNKPSTASFSIANTDKNEKNIKKQLKETGTLTLLFLDDNGTFSPMRKCSITNTPEWGGNEIEIQVAGQPV